MSHDKTSADNTDVEDKFEDAADSAVESKPDSPVNPTHQRRTSEPDRAASPTKEAGAQINGNHGVDESGKPESTDSKRGLETDVEQADSSETSTITSPMVTQGKSSKSVKNMAAAFEQSETSVPAKQSAKSRFQGFSASLPSVPWGPPPPPRKTSDPKVLSPQPQAASTSRKVTAPFGWFSRASSSGPKSPPLPARTTFDHRRNTAASVSTLSSNPDLSLTALDEEGNSAQKHAKVTLKEKFKLLRLREEAGIVSLDDTETKDGTTIQEGGLGVGVAASPGTDQGEKSFAHVIGSATSPLVETPPVNPTLAPGTVSGVSTSPSDAAVPIDWDFWQTVVNEGPQAVARTSPEELTAAISGGIPQTIRGVIWQVLAGSKNDELEAVYNELRSKGPMQDSKESNSTLLATNSQVNGSGREKESVASSRSSVRSDHSTPATSTNHAIGSPSPSHESSDPMHAAKLQVQLATERARKAKEDAAALSKLEKMIRRDMGSRTSYSKYTAAAGLQDALFNVCKSYALFDDAVGYPQGMNFIIMPLLFVMSEEEAFCLLVRMMNKYQLRELFVNDMPGLHLHLYQFERLLEDLEPALYCHLDRRGVTPKLYATQWFLTLFAYRFPLQLVMRVFDLVLCEGLEGAILKFGMAVIQRNVATLLGMNDMQALTTFLKERIFDVYIDAAPSSKSILESGFFGNSGTSDNEIYRADLLVQDACAIKLTPEMLNRYREEWEEKTKTEKARETELENLRTDSVTKAAQIRSLEQRAEKSDAEHIEIANELVKLKVENSELQDWNETLRGQVEELKKVADSEAKNVEERLRAGTDQVMQRNIEVQNENRHMEEQMAEMEKELVEMKMKYAQLNADNDSLKQKWNDLRKALD